jgi:hypothetical protein
MFNFVVSLVGLAVGLVKSSGGAVVKASKYTLDKIAKNPIKTGVGVGVGTGINTGINTGADNLTGGFSWVKTGLFVGGALVIYKVFK